MSLSRSTTNTAQTAQTPLARPRPSHARRPHPQRPPVRRAGLWKKTHRAATAAIPRRREARHEGCRQQHRVLGEPSSQPVQVERSPDQTPQIRGGEADTSRHREARPQKTKRQPRQTRDRTQMQPLQQRLSLPHRPLQPQTPVLQPSRQLGCYPWSTLTDGGLLAALLLGLRCE